MPSDPPAIHRLNKQHDRAAFRCGVESLDRYLRHQAGQDTRRDVTSVYVLEGDDGKTIKGYYTLSAYSIRSETFPPEIRKHWPRYDSLPAYLLGRLAVDENYKGQGLGKLLLVSALRQCVQQHQAIAATAVVVDAIDDKAAAFYQHYHFEPFPNTPGKLFIRMKLLLEMFNR